MRWRGTLNQDQSQCGLKSGKSSLGGDVERSVERSVVVGIYDRQREIDLSYPKRVTIAGCGGVGFWSGLFLAMAGVKQLDLVDPDVIEPHNLNRLPLSQEDIGKDKVRALKEWIIKLRPEAIVHAHRVAISPAIIDMLQPEVLIDATDDFRIQSQICDYCVDNSIVYVRAGYDGGTRLSIHSRVAKWDGNMEVNPHYEVVPSWVVPAVIAGALAVAKVMLQPDMEVAIDLTTLGRR